MCTPQGRLVHGASILLPMWPGPVVLVCIQGLARRAVAEALPDSQQLKHQALMHCPLHSLRIFPAVPTSLAIAGQTFQAAEYDDKETRKHPTQEMIGEPLHVEDVVVSW